MEKALLDRILRRIHRWVNQERFWDTEIELTVGATKDGRLTADYDSYNIALLLPLISENETFAALAELGLTKRYVHLSELARREKFEELWAMAKGAELAIKENMVSEELMNNSCARKVLDN